MHKKIVAIAAACSSLLFSGSQANDIEPSKEFYTALHRGAAPVVIDGNITEWTGVPILSDPKFSIPKGSGPGAAVAATCAQCVDDQASPNYVLWESLGGGTWTGPDDQTSAVEVVWDADNVYLGFIVTDDYHENTSGNAWNGDSVQLMVTKANRSGTQGVDFFLYNYALGGTDDAPADPTTDTMIMLETPAPGADTTDTEAVVRRDIAAKKTYYEIRLSARALGLTAPITAGTKFGLAMAINDGDLPPQDGQKGWGGLGAHALVYTKTPSEAALVTLSDQTPGADIVFFSAINPQILNFSFRANDKGTSVSVPSTAKLTVNGTVVTLVPGTKTDGAIDFTYTPTAPFAPGSVNTYSIEIKDSSGQTASESGSFTTPQYAVLAAADKVTPDTSKRGFMWNIHQSGPLTENSYVRAIDQLEGRLGPNRADPNAQGNAIAVATAPTDPTKPVTFEIETVINENIDPITDLTTDNFNDDAQMPGTPGIDPTPMAIGAGLNDGIAVDILTYVELTKGLHTLIVNSDDGFKTFVGQVNDIFRRKLAGSFDLPGGRGAADTAFQVFVPEDGVYALRTIFHQGGGGGNIELVEQLADGTKVLLNDDANGGPKTYRAATGSDVAGLTSVTSVAPGSGTLRGDGNAPVKVLINEGTDAVDLSSVVLKIDGNTVPTTPTRASGTVTVSGSPANPLTARALHNASITFKAGSVTRTETWSFTTTRFPSGTLFIEGEDFNFGKGQYITDQPIGMTGYYSGGAYLEKGDGLGVGPCLDTDHGIDYLDDNALDAGATGPYRSNVNVEAAKLNGPAGRDRGLFFVDVDHTVGWTSTAEWMNYTRDFPTTGITTYNVYARMAKGDGGTRGGILSTVDGDTAACNQTTTELGRFSAINTGGWDTWPDAGTDADALIPMKDSGGGVAVLKISGHKTLRFQYDKDAGDIDYLVFIPTKVTGLPPKVTVVNPGDGVVGWGSTQPFNATIVKGEIVSIASVGLSLDGVAVTPTVNLANGGATVSYTPPPLSSGLHQYVLTYTDNDTPAVVRSNIYNFSVSFTPFTPGTLFIEAEDFNFGHGQYITDQKIGMDGAYPGGAYAGKGTGLQFDQSDPPLPIGLPCDGSDLGVDYMDNATSDQAVYRPNTTVEAGKTNGPAGQNRQLFMVNANHTVGWTDSTEWMNYTRQFPAAASYRVFARMAHGGAVDQNTRGGILFKVSGDTTKCASTDQTTEELGHFQAPTTGGWDTWPDAGTPADALIPMKDADGNIAKVTLGGLTTLRFQYADNAGDFDYLAFVPVGNTPPKIISSAPQSGAQKITPFFQIVLQDQDLTVTGTSLKLDGAAVTPTVNKVGDTTTVSYQATGLTGNTSHTFLFSYTDSGGTTRTVSSTFTTTFTPLPQGTLFIEAEDFNFGHGQYVTDQPIGMTGPYPGGAYQDKGDGIGGSDCDESDFGIDYHDTNPAQDDPANTAIYRPTTGVEAAKRNGPAGNARGTFTVAMNHTVGWTDANEWMNYTRDFPTPATAYKVFARMARDVGGRRGGILFQVNGDPTKCAATDQTTVELGRFSAPDTGGWDSWPDAGTDNDALIPLKDGAGAVTTVTLGGKTTLRFQYNEAAGDIDYLAFVPTGDVTPPAAKFTKFLINANGSITIEWTGGGTLETTPNLTPNAVWTPVPGASSPFTFTPQAGTPILFARIKQ